MSIAYSGRGTPRWPRYALDGLVLRAHVRLRRTLTIRDAGATYRFRCGSVAEYNRATHMLIQEPGTIAWLRSRARAGDVIYDIGANIGVYSLIAAHAAGDHGRVFAFEPHLATAASLSENVQLNALADRVTVVCAALHDRAGAFVFRSAAVAAGSALSRLEDARAEGGAFATTDLKLATTIDQLVESGTLAPPALLKVDVDGNELPVLRGASAMLADRTRRPRSIQVELNAERDELTAFLADHGYRLLERHHSLGARAMLRAAPVPDPDAVTANGIFEPG